MKQILIMCLFVLPGFGFAQSDTIKKWNDKYEDAFTMFFYKNTLQMFNQTDSKEFEALIQDIEKMKFMRIDKAKSKFEKADLKALVSDYNKEGFESLLNMRSNGAEVQAFLLEEDNQTKGMALVVMDETNVMVLDIVGSIPLEKITELAALAKNID